MSEDETMQLLKGRLPFLDVVKDAEKLFLSGAAVSKNLIARFVFFLSFSVDLRRFRLKAPALLCSAVRGLRKVIPTMI